MSTLQQIETAILSLPDEEFEQLRQWFLDLDFSHWDEQIAKDIEEGKLESLAQEAIRETDWETIDRHHALLNTNTLPSLPRLMRKSSSR